MSPQLNILTSYEDIEPYIDLVRAGADSERNSFGFLPPSAYWDAAEKENLFVAVNGNSEFMGHLMFGGAFPHLKVLQTYSTPESRKRGVAHSLIDKLVNYAQDRGYLSLSAKVASDLDGANAFYGRMGFQVVKTLPGGRTRNRLRYYRVRDLDTPSLLDLLSPTEDERMPSLGLAGGYSSSAPIYAIDLNVLFDVSKQRGRGKAAGMVIRAATSDEIRMVITEEFVEELKRTTQKFPDDPYLQIALQMKMLKAPRASEIKGIEDRLAPIIFPERSSQNILTTQDKSDLRHLAIAVHHGIDGFITSEKAILRAHDFLRTEYKLDVLGVSDFADAMPLNGLVPDLDNIAKSDEVELKAAKLTEENKKAAISFLRSFQVPPSTISHMLSKGDTVSPQQHILVIGDGEIISLAAWNLTSSPKRTASVHICADESLSATRAVVDFTLDKICKAVSTGAPARLCLHLLPGHTETKQVALAHGFRPEPGQEDHGIVLHKLALGGVVEESTWNKTRKALSLLADVELPTDIPMYEGSGQAIGVKTSSGQQKSVPLQELETLLSPAIIILPDRHGTIAPIRRIYADDLLGTGNQISMFAAPEASLLKERVFYSTTRNASLFTPGTPVLFYESAPGGGRSSVVAVGRATMSTVLTSDQVNSDTKRKGVLDGKGFELIGKSEKKLVTRIDNIMVFGTLVPQSVLREIGCWDGANLVKAKRIEHHHLLAILNIGMKK